MNLQYVTDNLGQKNAVLLSMIDWKKIEKEKQELKELRRYKKLKIALTKLQQLLDLATEKDKEKLRIELSKIVPENKNASVHPKIGWGHYDDLIQSGSAFKVEPCIKSNKKESVFTLFSRLIKMSDFDDTHDFIEAFDIILDKKPDKIVIGVLPATEIANKTSAVNINFKIILK